MRDLLDRLGTDLALGRLVPYLGPGLLSLEGEPAVPDSPQALAAFFGSKAALPRRVRGNLWGSAQVIETSRHRQTVQALMRQAFAGPVQPTALHRLLAGLRPPLVVAAWYDDALERALAGTSGWGLVAGTSKHAVGRTNWWTTRSPDGTPVADGAAEGWHTLVYKPHGCVAPAADMLVSDSDYVEVLTEIDIQTPIPPAVKALRQGRGFLFLGCRFDDQLLRTYARQLLKSAGRDRYAVLEGPLSKGEGRFLAEQGITRVDLPLAEVALALGGVRA